MLDRIQSRMWSDHHHAFGQWVDRAAAAIRGATAHFAGWDGSSHQLIALVAAFWLTALNISFAGSAA